MYLKNSSDTAVVILNTVVGKIGLRPQEIINLEHKVLPPISDKVVRVTEEEYLSFRKGPKEDLESMEETKTEDSQQTGREDTANTIESVQSIIEDVSKNLVDTSALDFVKSLLNPKFEDVGSDPETDPLSVQETDSVSEVSQLEKQIEDLKQTWKTAPTPKKKDKISKHIKELQKQLEKLSKNADE